MPALPSSTPAPAVAVDTLNPGDLLAKEVVRIPASSVVLRQSLTMAQIDAALPAASPERQLVLMQAKTRLLTDVVQRTHKELIRVWAEQKGFAAWEKAELTHIRAGHQRLEDVARILTVAAPHLAAQGEALEVYWAGQDLARLELQRHAEFWQHRHAAAFNQLAIRVNKTIDIRSGKRRRVYKSPRIVR